MFDNKKDVKALILSGGGVRGAFQYGAIEYLYKNVLKDEERFKIICGVSAGALNGSIIAQHKFQKGKEIWMDQIERGVPAFKFKFPLWLLIVYGILPGVFLWCKLNKTDSVYTNKGLRKILDEETRDLVKILEETDTYFRVGIVKYQTGEYLSANPTDPQYRNRVVDTILASTTIPLIFPPVWMKSHQYFDGGVISATPFSDIFAITRQQEFREKYDLSVIYSVLCSPLSTQETHQDYSDMLDIGLRSLDILMQEIYLNDKDIFDRTNAYVWFREEIEKIFPDQEELDKIYEKIKKETGVDIQKYFTAKCKTIAPDPSKWKDYLESDLYPGGLKKPKKSESSEELFWEQFPGMLEQDSKKLMAAYHFGIYMAREILGSGK